MTVDVKTLFLLTIYIEAILGLLLLFAWVQNPGNRAVAWWGSAHLLRSLSAILFGMLGVLPELVAIDAANAILFMSYAVTWTGARLFDGRGVRPGTLVTGATVWVLFTHGAGLALGAEVKTLLSAGIIAAFSWGTAFEFWRGRAEHLVSRWPAIFILFAHGGVALLRGPIGAVSWTQSDPIFFSGWLTVVGIESLLFPISLAFILLAMAKERVEVGHKTAAMTDALTGLVNRRAFFDQAAKLAVRQEALNKPVSVFMIDLDHFKSINDRFGHGAGDRVLQVFAACATGVLRSSDIVARLGGEEFAVMLADADRDNAFVVAERVRAAFGQAGRLVDGLEIGASASIGVSIMRHPAQTVSELLAEADRALYDAKATGRNRVALATPVFDTLVKASIPARVRAAESRTAA